MISSLMGTDTLELPNSNILFLEDVNEFMYKIDRMLVQLSRSKHLLGTKGIIFSDMRVRDPGIDNSLGFELLDLIKMHFNNFDGPIAMGVPCGHTQRQILLPLNQVMALSVDTEICSLDFNNASKMEAA